MNKYKTNKKSSNYKKRSKNQSLVTPKSQLYRQLYESDVFVIDYAVALSETADGAFDLYTVIFNSVDYTNLLITYGEISYQSITFTYSPYFQGSSLVTDYANGVFGTRQGVFDVTVTAKTIASLIRTPGSMLIDNKSKWSREYPIVHNRFFSSSETNTAVSDVPKLNYYVCWLNNASTNTSKGLLYLKLVVRARCKVD